MDDRHLIIHLDMFYHIVKIQGGMIQLFLPKVRVRVDVIEVNKLLRPFFDQSVSLLTP